MDSAHQHQRQKHHEQQHEKSQENPSRNNIANEAKKKDNNVVVSEMKPVTQGAYGGGLYGTDDDDSAPKKAPASLSQSADGEAGGVNAAPKSMTSPPSSGDRDIDITGQSYIQ